MKASTVWLVFFFSEMGWRRAAILRREVRGNHQTQLPHVRRPGAARLPHQQEARCRQPRGATCPDALVPHVWAPFVVGQTPPDLIPSLEGCLPGHRPLRCGFYTNISLHEVGLSCFFRRKGRQSLFWSVLDSRNRSIFEVIFTMLCKKKNQDYFDFPMFWMLLRSNLFFKFWVSLRFNYTVILICFKPIISLTPPPF